MELPAPVSTMTYNLELLPPQRLSFNLSFPFFCAMDRMGGKHVLTLMPEPHPPAVVVPVVSGSVEISTSNHNNDNLQENFSTSAKKEGAPSKSGSRQSLRIKNIAKKVPPSVTPPPKVAKRRGRKLRCYSSHMRTHSKEKPFSCPHCKTGFKRGGDYTRHIRLHNPDPKIHYPFKCPQCRKSFTRKGGVTRHIKHVHLQRKDYPCPLCPKEYTDKSTLTRHLDSIHLNIRHQCRLCQKSYVDKYKLRVHLRKLHKFSKLKYSSLI